MHPEPRELREAARRRPHHKPEVPVEMVDGGTWWLMRPRVRLGGDADAAVLAFGRDYEVLLDEFFRTHADPFPDPVPDDGPDDDESQIARNARDRAELLDVLAERFGAEVDLAVALVRASYDVSVPEAEWLIGFDYRRGAPGAATARHAAIVRAAIGANARPTVMDYMRGMYAAAGAMGVGPGGILLEDARLGMQALGRMGRTTDPADVVPWLRDRAELQAINELL